MLDLRPDANTQWNRKPSPKPSSSDRSWAKVSAPISKAASDNASALHNFGRFMRDPIENAGRNGVERRSAMRLYIGMHGAWESTTFATLLACAVAQIATFTVDKGLVSVFMICSRGKARRKSAEEKRRGKAQRKRMSVQRKDECAEEG